VSGSDINNFIFRDLHPKIRIGTASDRYAGWTGQIYTPGKYEITTRIRKVGKKSFKEEILPIESVVEYFDHFPVLEVDFTFYRPLLNRQLEQTSSYTVLQTYNKYLRDDDRLILKVPQVIFAQKLWQGSKQVKNENYLNADMFINQFYDPANAIMGEKLEGFIFEQEYLHKADRMPPGQYVEDLDDFIKSLPKDSRYHIETRTDYYHTREYFDMLYTHGVGNVFSHWTWLPPLKKQFLKAGQRFCNRGKNCIVRLLTPLRMKYNDSYEKTFPFDRTVEGLMNPEMIPETIEIIKEGNRNGVCMNVILNNRCCGNAPLLAKEISGKFAFAYL
jgi:hypothetical protein